MTEYQEQVDRIAGVRDQQTALITQIKAALDGKTAGGGETALGTCTVSVTFSDGVTTGWLYNSVVDGEIVPVVVYNVNSTHTSLVFENVLCNSCMYIVVDAYFAIVGVACDGGVELLNRIGRNPVFKTPSTDGAAGTIRIYNDD